MPIMGNLLKVLKQNEEYLRHNDFEMLYYKLNEAFAEGILDPDHIGEFTSWVLSKGKDPMQTLTYVPANYLYQEQTAKELCVPEGTEFIYDYTATGSNIEVLYLPKTITTIKLKFANDFLYFFGIPAIRFSSCLFRISSFQTYSVTSKIFFNFVLPFHFLFQGKNLIIHKSLLYLVLSVPKMELQSFPLQPEVLFLTF